MSMIKVRQTAMLVDFMRAAVVGAASAQTITLKLTQFVPEKKGLGCDFTSCRNESLRHPGSCTRDYVWHRHSRNFIVSARGDSPTHALAVVDD